MKQDKWTASCWKTLKYLPVLSLVFEVKTKQDSLTVGASEIAWHHNAFFFPPHLVMECFAMYYKSLKTKKDVLTLKNLQAEEKPISNCSQKGAYIRLTQAQHEFIPYASRPFCSHKLPADSEFSWFTLCTTERTNTVCPDLCYSTYKPSCNK